MIALAEEDKTTGPRTPGPASAAPPAAHNAGASPPVSPIQIPSTAPGAPPAYTDTRYTPVSPQTATLARTTTTTTTTTTATRSASAGKEQARSEEGGAMRAVSKGLFAIVAAPAVVAGAGLAGVLAVLYGAGKLVEGIGKGLAAGPEAAYRKYQAREERSVERRRKGKRARGRP